MKHLCVYSATPFNYNATSRHQCRHPRQWVTHQPEREVDPSGMIFITSIQPFGACRFYSKTHERCSAQTYCCTSDNVCAMQNWPKTS